MLDQLRTAAFFPAQQAIPAIGFVVVLGHTST
jgi:hypothetical protein